MSEENVVVSEAQQPTSISDLTKKMMLKGTVTRLELYGAFVDIGLGFPAILHLSQLGKRVNRVSDVLSVSEEVTVWVDKVDHAAKQIMLTLVEPLAVEWSDLAEGSVYTGKVMRLENFGAFIDIGAEKEGLAHVSELSHDYIRHPSEALSVDDEVQVQVLGFSKKKRRINLSLKALQEKPEAALEELSAAELEYDKADFAEEMPSAMEMAFRSAMNGGGDGVPMRGKPRKGRGQQMDTGRKGRNKNNRRLQDEIIMRTLSFSEDED